MNPHPEIFDTSDRICPSPEPTYTRLTTLRHGSSEPILSGNSDVLPEDYTPSKYDVICGKGKNCYNAVGNRRFRIIVDMHLERYSLSTRKSEKSSIVSEIVQTIHNAQGRFIKRSKGRWVEISDSTAREKVGALFRDTLHFQYRSSGKAKTARKKLQRHENVQLQRHQSAPLPPRETFVELQNNRFETRDEPDVPRFLDQFIHEEGIGDDEFVKQDLVVGTNYYCHPSQTKQMKAKNVGNFTCPRRSQGSRFLELRMTEI